jgi:hypothetical protein
MNEKSYRMLSIALKVVTILVILLLLAATIYLNNNAPVPGI